MARPFDDTEKQAVRRRLLAKGSEMFARYGPQRTSIQELTAAAGIGQGTFYHFFESKEELFFAVLEREEIALREQIGNLLSEAEPTRKGLKSVLRRSLELLRDNPIIGRLLEGGMDYGRFLARVSPERLATHVDDETRHLDREIRRMQAQGVAQGVEPRVLAGLLHGLFVMHLHRGQIGHAVFPKVMDLLTDMICDALATRGDRNLSAAGPANPR